VITRHHLANGLQVFISRSGSVPVVAVSLWYGVGSADEQPGRTGLAHLFEHLMFQGSRNVAKGEHFSMVQAVGGRANAATGLDRTFYYERLPSHELELAIWLEAERLATLAEGLDQLTLDNQRDVVRNERRWRIDNQPYGDAEEQLQSLAYPTGHPYAHEVIGSMEDLAAASLDDVRAFFAAYYRASNACLAIVGDVDTAAVIRMVERHFGPIRAGSPAPPRGVPPSPARAADRTIDADVALARCYLTYPIPPLASADWDAGNVVADLLGRGRASRLFQALVQSRLAQAVSVWTYPLLDDPARLTIEVTARPDLEPDRLVERILDEVDLLGAEGPSGTELERVRNLRHAEHAGDMERSQERADRIGMYASLLGTPERVDQEMDRYASVGPEQVREFVGRNLTRDRAVRLTYRPSHARR
jgi:predicted Zn-dependent peptidase